MAPKLKIALVSQPYDGVRPPHQNSVGISVYELSRKLAQTHEVTVIASHRPGSHEPPLDDGVHYHYLSLQLDLWFYRQNQRFARVFRRGEVDFSSAYYYFPYALRAARLLSPGQFDIIQLINLSQFVPVIRTFNPRSKIILNMRCEWLSQLPRDMVAKRIGKADRIIGCSRHITGRVKERFPDQASKCQTVYNGVDLKEFAFAPVTERSGAQGARTVLFVGRVSPEKGIHVLIDALPEIVAKVPDLQVKIVGSQQQLPLDFLVGLSDEDWVADLKAFYPDDSPTAYISILRKKLAASGLSDRVEFIEQLPYAEVHHQMRQADVLVNPSLSDAFPRAPIEAMATGLPVVAARVGGVVESVVDQQTGFLVAPASSEELAAAVSRLLTDDELREKMGVAARAHIVENFSWQSIAEDLEHEYREAFTSDD